MLHHLYGILERPPQPSRLPEVGVDDRPVLVRPCAGLVVLSTLIESVPRPTATALSRHQDVQAAVTVPGPFFPCAYGVSVPVGEIEAWLAMRARLVRAGLRTVRAHAEMRVSILALHFGDGDPARLARVADRVAEASGLKSWRSRVSGGGANATITLAFLVPRTDVAGFLARIAPIASRAGDVAVVPSGPWPPSTFVPGVDPLPWPAVAVPGAVRHAV
jgi:hypothetical protein